MFHFKAVGKKVMKAAIIMHNMIIKLLCKGGYESEMFEKAKREIESDIFIDDEGVEREFK